MNWEAACNQFYGELKFAQDPDQRFGDFLPLLLVGRFH